MTTDAYAAGLLDGEGCIYVVEQGRSFYATVEVGMTAKASSVLDWLKTNYGGNIYDTRPATEKWDAAKMWHLHGQAAAEMLERCLPHLILKARQAELAVGVQKIRDSLVPPGGQRARWTEEASHRCKVIRQAIHELNRKGPMPEIEPLLPWAVLLAQRVGGEWVLAQGDLFSETGWARSSGSWPTSGMASRGVCWTVNTSESPRDAVASSLSDILVTGPVPQRYFLTPRAARGILRRAQKRGKELPATLQEALKSVANSV